MVSQLLLATEIYIPKIHFSRILSFLSSSWLLCQHKVESHNTSLSLSCNFTAIRMLENVLRKKISRVQIFGGFVAGLISTDVSKKSIACIFKTVALEDPNLQQKYCRNLRPCKYKLLNKIRSSKFLTCSIPTRPKSFHQEPVPEPLYAVFASTCTQYHRLTLWRWCLEFAYI